ncbi:MAG: MBL fold metallo-hydrolase, partial [Pseudooceanicola sp.]|nr:MBL fold metallo-hydrolase [Pseudooceanicola sp.]
MTADTLTYPWDTVPPFGDVREVRDGILWTRIPLPYRLDHVNVYLVRDTNGWALIDTGIQTDEAKATWDALFEGPLKGITLSKIIVTHFHPDHIGLAGWL